jgi:alpha-1,3-rhamnosyl/mannosyltransferase
MLRFTAAVRRARPDVLFYPAVYSWFPCPPGLPNLLTLHDAIAEHYPQLVFPERRFRMLWNTKVRLARWQATRFLTVSQAARREIETYMGIEGAKIDVTTEGPKAAFQMLPDRARKETRARLCERFALPDGARYYTYVGGFAPHKNLLGLARAFARVAAPDVHLLLVGDIDSSGFHSNIDELRRLVTGDAALAGRVHFTGYVDDALLARIYATSIATVLPSFSEGFGLPAVESMACGTPVIGADAGSLPEVIGDAGRLFNPHDLDALTACLRELAGDSRLAAELQERALARAGQFSWDAAARLALASIERCATQAGR